MRRVAVPVLSIALSLAGQSLLFAGEAEGDKELQLVFIGSSECGFCKKPAMKDALVAARTSLAKQSAERGMAFVTVGIATDDDVDKGLRFLTASGAFDEIVVGAGFKNLGMTDYVWTQPPPGPDDLFNAGIPQLIVAEREFSTSEGRTVASRIRILDYCVGNGIPIWVKKGIPLGDLMLRK